MKKIIALAAITILSASAHAKTLTVSCQSQSGRSVQLVSEIANINTPQQIASLSVDGVNIDNYRDISQMPIYKEGNINLKIQLGKQLYSSVELSLVKCQDDFEATGKGTLSKYVGGFMGSEKYGLQCTCSLK